MNLDRIIDNDEFGENLINDMNIIIEPMRALNTDQTLNFDSFQKNEIEISQPSTPSLSSSITPFNDIMPPPISNGNN